MSVSKLRSRGFIALISVFIISFVFLVAIISLGQFGLAGRLLLLDTENKIRSEEYAEGCVQIARVLILNDPKASEKNVPVESEEVVCTIVSIEPDVSSSGESTIQARAEVLGTITNFVVVVDQNTRAVVSWEEVVSLP